MDDYDSWLAQSSNTNEIEQRIEHILDEYYKNPYEEDYFYIKCPSCGEKLYEGDVYYPELLICEHCLIDYKRYVELEE